MTASAPSFSVAAKAPSNSSLLLILRGLIVVPVASPASWTFSRKGLEKGSVGHAACRWQQLPDEFDAFAGQLGGYASDAGDISAGARKARDQPGANRISSSAMTIGIWLVACFAAWVVGVNQVTITSTLRWTSSAANSGTRSTCPSADRNSN